MEIIINALLWVQNSLELIKTVDFWVVVNFELFKNNPGHHFLVVIQRSFMISYKS